MVDSSNSRRWKMEEELEIQKVIDLADNYLGYAVSITISHWIDNIIMVIANVFELTIAFYLVNIFFKYTGNEVFKSVPSNVFKFIGFYWHTLLVLIIISSLIRLVKRNVWDRSRKTIILFDNPENIRLFDRNRDIALEYADKTLSPLYNLLLPTPLLGFMAGASVMAGYVTTLIFLIVLGTQFLVALFVLNIFNTCCSMEILDEKVMNELTNYPDID